MGVWKIWDGPTASSHNNAILTDKDSKYFVKTNVFVTF